MKYDQLKLDNQLCFALYAVSHLITRRYQPYLDELGITYPQYLVLLVLWETDGLPVNEISKKLMLNTNTVTPLLKRMEKAGLINRSRSGQDERKVVISLTDDGRNMREKAAEIPGKLAGGFIPEVLSMDDVRNLKETLERIIAYLSQEQRSSAGDPPSSGIDNK
ncbi:MAG: MarR family transcriptional regulator [FCB group bacterium]|nr:MarR family transcriptional regulator [FCB group bacterium]